MSPEQCKRIVYDLSLEYMKQRKLLSDVDSNIPVMVNRFADVCDSFCDAVIKNDKLNRLF
ncbi:hypothetical protein SAMN05443270_3000 [Lacrimispora sphenoides]|uniref:hypothetical protein n=1 Tax=Lacrimispora sphenoides TaxID=29370 RepID=UPI0008C7A202|nr:hypothetical protein [Lacrimispora sphenoides]SEU08095.1 hypothetical protein SAMN05443270_3000 [Lacrimispora sphenoides]